jgi:hypothetical protein
VYNPFTLTPKCLKPTTIMNNQSTYLVRPIKSVCGILALRQRYASTMSEMVIKTGYGWQVYETIRECIDAFNDPLEIHFGYERDLKRMIDLLQRN